jgi:hypothetical protein
VVGSILFVGFEVLTTVVRKVPIFWDIMPYSSLKIKSHFGRICYLHLQGRRIRQESNMKQAASRVLLQGVIPKRSELFAILFGLYC